MPEQAQTDRAPNPEDEKPKNKKDFIYQAISRFGRVCSSEAINRKEAVDDLRFKNGEQWPEDIRAERTNDKRPCLTVNKIKTFVHQITNEQRQNRPAINIQPVGDKGDPETAKMLKGLIRQIERQSNADVAYDTAFDSAVSGGWGYWRIITEYDGEDSFDQVIRIVRIRNPFRVYIDPDAQEPDGSDAQWGFISDMIPRAEFAETYPNAVMTPWEESGGGDEVAALWSTETHIRIAEYFYYETEMKRLVYLQNGHKGFYDDLAQEVKDAIKADPSIIVKERESPCKEVKWCKLTSHEVLEENEWLGKWIPIVRVIGDEVDIEGEVTYAGMIRDAKDPQRMKNYWVTAKTELVALAPKAPWIMEEGQVEGHEKEWRTANIKSNPYLLYKGTNTAGKPSPAPQRQQFAGPPTGVIQAEESAEQDMMAVTGVRFDATKGERTSNESGIALNALKMIGELGSFHYVDNLRRALIYTGRQLVDLIPKYIDTKRVLTILREDETQQQVTIDPTQMQPYKKGQDDNGKVQHLYNPKIGEYEVVVTTGPSFATKRQESAQSQIEFLKVLPNAAPLIGDLIAKNMDWPGADQIAERLQAMLPPQLLEQEEGDLPPEAKSIVQSLKQQLQQLHQENQTAKALLGDQEKDRELEKYKIDHDYDSKMVKIAADLETKMGGMIQQHAQALKEAVAQIENQVTMTQQEMQHRMELQQIQQSAEQATQQASQKAQGEAQTKEPAAPSMPVINLHLPTGKKKKITAPDGKVYFAEDVLQ
mgnify:CR=1 FL=1